MKDSSKKRVTVVSEDRSTTKLIDFMLSEDNFSVDVMSSLEFDGRIGKGSPTPNLIIYDYSGPVKGENLLCQTLKQYPQYDKTPRVVISTFLMECESCPEYKSGKCGHIQKPFHLNQVRRAIDKLVKGSGD